MCGGHQMWSVGSLFLICSTLEKTDLPLFRSFFAIWLWAELCLSTLKVKVLWSQHQPLWVVVVLLWAASCFEHVGKCSDCSRAAEQYLFKMHSQASKNILGTNICNLRWNILPCGLRIKFSVLLTQTELWLLQRLKPCSAWRKKLQRILWACHFIWASLLLLLSCWLLSSHFSPKCQNGR